MENYKEIKIIRRKHFLPSDIYWMFLVLVTLILIMNCNINKTFLSFLLAFVSFIILIIVGHNKKVRRKLDYSEQTIKLIFTREVENNGRGKARKGRGKRKI